MNLHKLKLGTKIVSTILFVIVICLGIMSYVVISRSATIQLKKLTNYSTTQRLDFLILLADT